MKRSRFLILFFCSFIFCISILEYPVCFAAEMGSVQLNLDVYSGFDRSVMVNLVGQEGENYLIVAEPENGWNYDVEIPVGEYSVEYVGVDDVKNDTYDCSYKPKVLVKKDLQTVFEVKITQEKKKANSSEQRGMIEERKDLTQIIKGSAPSLIFIGIAALLLGFIKYKKEKREYGC